MAVTRRPPVQPAKLRRAAAPRRAATPTEQDAAKTLFDSFKTWRDLRRLVDEGQAESVYMECKAPGSPQLGVGLRSQLAEAVSAFANSQGGVIIWGVDTSNQPKSGLDVVTDLVPIGNVASFALQVDRAMTTVVTPMVPGARSKAIAERAGATRGAVVTLVPRSPGDPVQTTTDNKFHMRAGHSNVPLPYELIRRMFAATTAPDLVPRLVPTLTTKDDDGSWTIPIVLDNMTTAAAHDALISVEILNSEACTSVEAQGLSDISSANPGMRIFSGRLTDPIYRGISAMAGNLHVVMKRRARTLRVLKIRVRVFADHMRATEWNVTVQLAGGQLRVKSVEHHPLY
jgi:hypothetical protein